MNTIRLPLIAGAVALMSFGGATLSAAEELDRPFRITVGGLFPSDDDVTDLTEDTHFNLGLSYDLWGKLAQGRYYRGGVFFDLSTSESNGNRYNAYGFGGFGRLYLGDQSTSAWRPYVGASLGVYFLDYELGAINDESSRLGAGIFGGIESLNGLFGQVGYRWIGSDRGFNASGLTLSAGFRF